MLCHIFWSQVEYKIICFILNCKARPSFKSAKLPGIFEGAEDNQENIKTIFGPIIDKIENFDINQLGNVIIRPPNAADKNTLSDNAPFVPGIENESEKIQELARTLEGCYDNDKKIFSIKCRNCQSLLKRFGWKGNVPSAENAVKNIHKTYGGDWEWLKNISGLTGLNGRHFCFDCMVSLSDTPPGIPHAQVIFPRYSDDDTVTKRSFTP